MKTLLQEINVFLREQDMRSTNFGRIFRGDPRFVLDLRLGRIPREKTAKAVLLQMEEYKKNNPAKLIGDNLG